MIIALKMSFPGDLSSMKQWLEDPRNAACFDLAADFTQVHQKAGSNISLNEWLQVIAAVLSRIAACLCKT